MFKNRVSLNAVLWFIVLWRGKGGVGVSNAHPTRPIKLKAVGSRTTLPVSFETFKPPGGNNESQMEFIL